MSRMSWNRRVSRSTSASAARTCSRRASTGIDSCRRFSTATRIAVNGVRRSWLNDASSVDARSAFWRTISAASRSRRNCTRSIAIAATPATASRVPRSTPGATAASTPIVLMPWRNGMSDTGSPAGDGPAPSAPYARACASNSRTPRVEASAFSRSASATTTGISPPWYMSHPRSAGRQTATRASSNRREMWRASASRPPVVSVVSSTSRLKSNNRVTSLRRETASRVRSRAASESLLAITATIRNAKSATQFSGSAMVNVPTGGRKKKLRTSIATIDTTIATPRRLSVAAPSTTSSSASATVIGLIAGRTRGTAASAAMAAMLPVKTTASRRFNIQPLLPRRREAALGERVLKRAKAVLARRGPHAFLSQRERQRADVRVSPRQRYQLRIEIQEPVERGRRSGQLCTRRRRGYASKHRQLVAGNPRRCRHAPLDPRHHRIVGFCDVRRLQRLDLANRRHCGCGERLDAPRVGPRGRHHSVERRLERIGRLTCRAEREALRLEVGVLDGQVEHAAIERAILGKALVELVEQTELVRVLKRCEQRPQGGAVLFNRLRRLLRFARKHDGRLVRIRHDRPVRRVAGLAELDEQVCGELVRVHQALNACLQRGCRTGRQTNGHMEYERSSGDSSSG